MNSDTLTLSEAVAAFFEAKRVQLQEMPECRLLDVGPLKCIHNHPRWPEVDGFYALDVPPAEVVRVVQDYGPDARHMITAFGSSSVSLQEAYRELGYQLIPWAEPFMVKRLSKQQQLDNTIAVQMRHMQGKRDYWIEEDGHSVCRGASILTSAKAVYVSGMNTLPAYRRRGLASVILNRIHADALTNGASYSILGSSPMGFPLYEARSYDVLAYMQAFVPVN